MQNQDQIKEKFTISLLNESVTFFSENLFEAIDLYHKAEKHNQNAESTPVNGKRVLSESSKNRAQLQYGFTKAKGERKARAAMLYSFISLEHLVFTVLNSLWKNNDQDFFNYKVLQKGEVLPNQVKADDLFWQLGNQGQTLQIKNLVKAIRYLLNRSEVTQSQCQHASFYQDGYLDSFVNHGATIRHTLVHGVSGLSEVTLRPTGKESVNIIDENKHTVTSMYSLVTDSVSTSSYAIAVGVLKKKGIFRCDHADGDPSHICLDMVINFVKYSVELIECIAAHYKIGIQASFSLNLHGFHTVRFSNISKNYNNVDTEKYFNFTSYAEFINQVAGKQMLVIKTKN